MNTSSTFALSTPTTTTVATTSFVNAKSQYQEAAAGKDVPSCAQQVENNYSSSSNRVKSNGGNRRMPNNNSKINDNDNDKLCSHDANNSTATAIVESAPSHPPLPEGYTTQDYSHLADAFKRPLFNNASSSSSTSLSMPLQIAYTHHTNLSNLRKRSQRKSNTLSKEVKLLEDKLQSKRTELALANAELQRNTQALGAWTRHVFDLELDEPCCEWNINYAKLKEYVERNDGKLPRSVVLDGTKINTDDEREEEEEDDEGRMLAAWLDGMRGEKSQELNIGNVNEDDNDEFEGAEPIKKKKKLHGNTMKKKDYKINNPLSDYPHRLELLTNLGVNFQTNNPNNNNDNNHNNSKSKNWESMFQKLVDYKEEHGTLRFPSDEQCLATKNDEFIALQRWVKGQVLAFRYSKKKKEQNEEESDSVRRLREIGFDFEKWCAKPGKKGKTTATTTTTKGTKRGTRADHPPSLTP